MFQEHWGGCFLFVELDRDCHSKLLKELKETGQDEIIVKDN